jgi:hypothetical protein
MKVCFKEVRVGRVFSLPRGEAGKGKLDVIRLCIIAAI